MKTTSVIRCSCGNEWVARDKKTVVMKSSVPFGSPPPVAPAPTIPRQGIVGSAKEWDVVVPLCISGVSGLLVALFMVVSGAAIRLALQGGICVTSVLWMGMIGLFFLSRYGSFRALIWAIEEHFGVDIDGDDNMGKPGKLTINGSPKRPRSWDKVSAADKVRDLRAFAVKAYNLNQADMGTGQKAFRGWGLPSRFKCNDRIHKILMGDLVNAGIGFYAGDGFEFVQSIESVRDLAAELDARVTA